MAYDISFNGGVDEAFEALDKEATSQVLDKLQEVATSEYRSPTDWDYVPRNGYADGKFKWDSYRVIVDINEGNETIVVHTARRRENLYR